MCLLIGSTGVGKTLLLKRLNHCSNKGNYINVGEAPATIPTVGTNLVNVTTSRKVEITVRELGGCMAPIWHNYYKDSNAIMFMVDMSNRQQVAASCIQLMEVLTDEQLKSAPVLLILNKVDVTGSMSRMELDSLFCLDQILENASQKITVLDTSAREGNGLQDVVRWIQEHCKNS